MAVLRAVLFLLSILGITLLVLLGLLLLILFVPVRYKGRVCRKEEPQEEMTANILISWCNPFFRFRLWLAGKKPCFTVRILGICIKDSRKEKKPKKEKKSKREKASQSKKDKSGGRGDGEKTGEQLDSSADKTETTEKMPKVGSGPAGQKIENGIQKKGFLSKFFEKIKGFLKKLQEMIEKIRAIPEKLAKKAEQIKASIRLLIKKKDKVAAFLAHEGNRQVFGETFVLLRKLFGHILPGKLKGTVVFGTGDPESTGKAVGILAVFYPVYAKNFTICPDFTDKRLLADVTFRGRIRAATLLWWLIRFWFKKETRKFRKRLQRLQKALQEKAE